MKKVCFAVLVIFLLAFTGCSVSDAREIYETRLGEYVLQTSNITTDDSYVQYTELAEEGKLDGEGRYNELGEYEEEFTASRNLTENQDDIEKRKAIHVTFASNSYLTVKYYYDADLKAPIDVADCYLNPGESIYAPQPECKNPYTNSYVFSEFRIYEYDADGERNRVSNMSDNKGSVLTIPEDFAGTELSVEPVGEYQKRKVQFNAYTIDKNGNQRIIIGGSWKINDELYTGDIAELSPSDAYIIKYCYDPEEYYLVESDPRCYSDNGGVVEFPRTTAMDQQGTYSVQLCSYCSALLEGDSKGIKKINSIKINDVEYHYEGDPVIKYLKTGDKVSIETTEEYRLFSTQVSISEETLSEGVYRYLFTVPEGNDQIRLYVNKSDLKVSVSSNVGNAISFDIEAVSISVHDLVYQKQTFNRDCTVYDGTIGPEEALLITAKGSSLPENHALRFDITKEDSNGNVIEEVAYISSLPGNQSINVYRDGQVENFTRIYKSIDIEIELVETMVYRQEKIENAFITVSYSDMDEKKEFKDGDIVEASRKVDVIIEPIQGYYVSGKNVSGDGYENTMKFEKYCSDITEIIEEHPVKKFVRVIFDASDQYGDCVFKIDGKELGNGSQPEEMNLKEGEKVTMEYTLTDSDYQILRESGGFWGGIKDWGDNIFNKNNIEIEIEITNELDGITITRDSYVNIEKK